MKRVSVTAAASIALIALLVSACKPSAPEQGTTSDKAATPAPATKDAAAAPVAAPPANPEAPFKGVAAGAGLDPNAPREDKPPVLEFATPRTVAVGKGDEVSFVIQDAFIEPRNPESVRVVLQLRMENRSANAVNLSDASFRLLTKDSVIPANGGLNVPVDPRSNSAVERVQFAVPLASVPRMLKIEHGGESVELPLRLVQ